MVPVLPPGTTVVANRWDNHLGPGDIIIFFHDGREKIKRIQTLENNKIYVLGDHKEESTDSRHFGVIDTNQVIGKVWWPRSPK